MQLKVIMLDPSVFTLPYDLALCKGLSAEGVDVTLYGRPLDENESILLPKKLKYLSFFYRFESGRDLLHKSIKRSFKGISHIFSMLSLINELKKISPDIIHVQWSSLPIIDKCFLSSLKKIAPTVLTVHDTNAFNGSPGHYLQRLGYASLLKQFDHLIVHTAQGNKRLIRMGVADGNISIVPHGVLDGIEISNSHEHSQAVDDGLVRYVVFGKMKPYKGIDILIDAVSKIDKKTRKKYRFIIAGQPYMDVEELIIRAKNFNLDDVFEFRTHYLTENEVDDLFNTASVLVFPYREIEASGVLMRSFSFCKAIIASRLGLFDELLTDSVHGCLVTPESVQELSDAIVRVGENEQFRKQCGANIAELLLSLPTWEDATKSTLEVYKNILRL